MRRALIDALEKKYEAEISAADATINIYLNNSVGIGEHPQHLEEIDKQVQKIADAQEKIKVLKSFEPERSVL
jgi:CO dehydrogenase nickel-insertion accessory protein CooC1